MDFKSNFCWFCKAMSFCSLFSTVGLVVCEEELHFCISFNSFNNVLTMQVLKTKLNTIHSLFKNSINFTYTSNSDLPFLPTARLFKYT